MELPETEGCFWERAEDKRVSMGLLASIPKPENHRERAEGRGSIGGADLLTVPC